MGLVLTWPVGRAAKGQEGAPIGAPAGPVLAYFAGASLGGAATGLVLAQIGILMTPGSASRWAVLAITAAVAAVAIAMEWSPGLGMLPERQTQVPRRWLRWRRKSLTALVFGIMIGSGMLTRLKHPVAYVLGVLLLLSPSLTIGVAIGLAYGASRGVTLVSTWLADRTTGRRPPWPSLTAPPRRLSQALAVVAALTVACAIVLASYQQ